MTIKEIKKINKEIITESDEYIKRIR
ncbi:uncharacterized protein METZ01_LOCUS474344 [marine metagenome]|uniref:Uncharacterized protein n=1 Tax=marine metagenome TaxID=408172 RepID=A0A383BNU4_9ZZZZ